MHQRLRHSEIIQTLPRVSVPQKGQIPAQPDPLPSLAQLSPQERRIVALFALDYTNKEVARELSIHPETVKTHCRRIYAKLGVRSKAGCVAMAYRYMAC